ncbi:unnamed protein product [Clavelina lepadiformis]|uniref:Uncharacterized protein n=1 Tax=Clavelina lepadiformis TaxID=159417 RepID=A0ABP0EUX7_CLALP
MEITRMELSARYDKWMRSFGLITYPEIYADSREDFIWHGYRPSPSSISYCLKSLFYPTNETLNVWTHFIPFSLMIWRSYRIYQSLDDPTNPETYPFWFETFALIILFFSSSCAHLFSCRSGEGREICFCIDYGSIGITSFALSVATNAYLCPLHCYGNLEDLFLPFPALLAVACGLIVCVTFISRHPSCQQWKTLLRFFPFIALCWVLLTPCFHRFFVVKFPEIFENSRYVNLTECNLVKERFPSEFILILCLMNVTSLVIGIKIPERWFPGMFDIVGHSHQCFHILSAICLYMTNVMAENGMLDLIKLKRQGLLKDENLKFSFREWLMSFVFFLAIIFTSGFYASKVLGKIVQEQRRRSNLKKT